MEVFAFQSIYFLIKSRAIAIQTIMVVRITVFATNVVVILGFLSSTKIDKSLESNFDNTSSNRNLSVQLFNKKQKRLNIICFV